MAARHWTPEQRARQSAIIRQWQPWGKSTGPRTHGGKAVSSKNVLVGNANRQKALERARAELKITQDKIEKLTRGKELSWLDRLMRENLPSSIR